jgi:predicted nucleotide-binding protein
MVRKQSPPPPEPEPELLTSREEAREKIEKEIKRGLELVERTQTERDYDNFKSDYNRWTSYTMELLSRIFTTKAIAKEFDLWYSENVQISPWGHERSYHVDFDSIRDNIKERVNALKSINERLELIPISAGARIMSPTKTTQRVAGNIIFIVHGHDEAAKQNAARFLEKFDLRAIILHEQAGGGRTLIEKLEHYSEVDFAIILLTPDDIGAERGHEQDLKSRARQNVILELGFFFGRIGRNRVCALHLGSIELPSDILGVEYIPMDSHGGWKLKLGKELQTAGFSVDLNKI